MALSMYDGSVPQFKKMLNNLALILKKGEEHATQKNITPDILVNARLFPDMFSLVKQVQIATDQVKNGLARLAGIEIPKFEDNEITFSDLYVRVEKTIQFLDQIKPEQVNSSDQKEIKFSIKEWNFEFVGNQYLFAWIIPNFYFHITTAYNILRHNGVEIGKADYLG